MFNFLKNRNNAKKSTRKNGLCDAQRAYTNFKDDLLRYDIATTIINKKPKLLSKERNAVSKNLYNKYDCSKHTDNLQVYDRGVHMTECANIDNMYKKKYYKGLKKKVSKIKKAHPNYTAEDVFNGVTGYMSFGQK